ncbi:MAG: DUF401 family protein [Micrococcales bacterium]|nr:DUF401 family protein [Micrococcales bacterium]
MEFTSSLLLHNQQYILLLAVVMAISFSAKKSQIFLPFYSWIARTVKSKRAVVAIISFVSGILPISGRVAVSAGALDTIAPTDVKKRKNFGIIDYLSTHHFYFWSPLEATVLTPMAVLGISYWSFMGKIWPLLLTAVTIILFYIFKVLKEDDIEILIPEKNKKKEKEEWQKQADIKADRRQITEYAKVLVFTSLVIVLGNVVKANFDTINEWVKSAHDHNLIILVALVGFLASLSLGSSGKFAGFVGISATVFGAGALPLFFAFDYAGYMLSPTHKCLVVGKSYFKTPLKDYYKAIASLVVPLMLVGSALYFMGLDL